MASKQGKTKEAGRKNLTKQVSKKEKFKEKKLKQKVDKKKTQMAQMRSEQKRCAEVQSGIDTSAEAFIGRKVRILKNNRLRQMGDLTIESSTTDSWILKGGISISKVLRGKNWVWAPDDE
eukprot:TRINITY_DN12777_c1_g3_i1.p1 TRINITY_DN12777_c1_g3~~TRINITY_DN12777_c1_g3_i1.p1  ORF type:complete len:133 (+),score=28.33 TRINITY_DN12777_c1_g3_i1:41-400(+)